MASCAVALPLLPHEESVVPSSRDTVIPDVPWATPAIPELLTMSSATGETSDWYKGASYH